MRSSRYFHFERVDPGDAAGRAEVDKIRARAAHTFEAMEDAFAKTPPDTRDKAKRVLDASAPGWERAAIGNHGKGKGPPWRRDSKSLPPGPQKKTSLDRPDDAGVRVGRRDPLPSIAQASGPLVGCGSAIRWEIQCLGPNETRVFQNPLNHPV